MDRTMNSTVAPPIMAKEVEIDNSVLARKNKRLGRGAVSSGLTCECGVFAAMACGEWPTQRIEIAQTICLGLVALQHRGQESAGIVTSEGICSKNFNVYKGMGMINTIFNDDATRKLKGNLGIGHTRYSTSASSEEVNCQPFVVHTAHGAMAVAHNGELINCESLRRNVLERGVGLSTHSDSELITQALCLNPNVTVMIYFITVSSFMDIYNNWPNLPLILVSLALGAAGLQAGAMYLSVGFKMKTVKKLHNLLQKSIDEEQNDDIKNLYWGVENKCRKMTVKIGCYLIMNETPVSLVPLLISLYYMVTGNYDTTTWATKPGPFNFPVPFDTTKLWGWYLLWFIQLNTSCCYSLAILTVSTYFVCCCFYICGFCDHFDYVRDSLTTDIKRKLEENNPVTLRQLNARIKGKMDKMVKIHVKCLEVYDLVTDINSGQLFWLFFCNLLFMAFSLYNIEHSASTVELLYQILCVFVSLLWPYLHCIYADSTLERVAGLRNQIYSTNWFDLPISLQKYLFLIITRSHQQKPFNGHGMVYCTSEVLAKLCKTYLSYYMLVRELA